ncbi:MAG: ATP-binding protein [Pseudomonadota bacterium]
MKSLAFLMRKDFVDHGDGKMELIEMIDTLADKSLAVISETLAHVMARSTPSIMSEFDLGAMCDDVLVLLDPFRVHAVHYPRVLLNADVTAMHIILRNLIDNAFKHAGVDTVTVDVSVTQMNPQRLCIDVADNGAGFGGTEHPVEPRVPSRRGYGLGAVHRLVKARGGKIDFGPGKDGTGVCVRIELPGRIQATAPEIARAM